MEELAQHQFPSDTEMTSAVVCFNRDGIYQWAFRTFSQLSHPNPAIPKFTHVQTWLMINSVGDFVVTMPFVNYNPR